MKKIIASVVNAAKKFQSAIPTEGRLGENVTTAPTPPYQRQAQDLTRYVWLHPGLNRSERNRLIAHIKSGKLKGKQLDTIKALLRESPKNSQSNGGINNPFYKSRREAVSGS